MKLHEAIGLVLRDHGSGWMDREAIAEEIARRDLFRQPSTGDHPPGNQVGLRVRSPSYAGRFESSDSQSTRIRLRDASRQSDEREPAAPARNVRVNAGLTENDVVEAVCAELETAGLEICSRLTTEQQGVDIVARGRDYQLLVEAKGATSSKPGTKRYGQPFNSAQVRTHVSRAFYTAATLLQRDWEVRTAVALPRTPVHERTAGPLMPSLTKLEIGLFWVGQDHAEVDLVSPWTL